MATRRRALPPGRCPNGGASLPALASLLAAVFMVSSCSSPAGDEDQNASPITSKHVVVNTATAPPVAMDFLWVIDHSASMCQEQRELARAAPKMMARLAAFDNGRMNSRSAVVNIQQAPDKTDTRVVGRFKHKAAVAFPPNCSARVRTPCLSDEQCASPVPYVFAQSSDSSLCKAPAPGQSALQKLGKWKCKGPKTDNGVIKVSAVSNHNCSINTSCESSCTKGPAGDEFCAGLFGADSQCLVPGGGLGLGGCIHQPDTAGCPHSADLPAVVDDTQTGLLRCLLSLGAAQTQESKFEGAFRSAWTALDPAGPNCSYAACVDSLRSCCTSGGKWCKETDPTVIKQNLIKCEKDKVVLCQHLNDDTASDVEACQNRRLLRPNGYLVMIFASNNDECSMRLSVPDLDDPAATPIPLHPHDPTKITKEIWEKCQTMNDATLSNRVLMEATCEVKQAKAATKGETQYCHVDCMVGSQHKDVDGAYKCAGGCKAGSSEQVACLAKADARMAEMDAEKLDFYSYRSSKGHLAGWQFAPVSEYVERFKSLKSLPGQVMAVAFGGDTRHGEHGDKELAEMEAAGKPLYSPAQLAQRHRDRVTYLHSALLDVGPGKAPSVCNGHFGDSEWGGALHRLCRGLRRARDRAQFLSR